MPDLIIVLADRPVGGKISCHGNIDDHLPCPGHPVLVGLQRFVLYFAIASEIEEGHEIILTGQLIIQLAQKVSVTSPAHPVTDQEVCRRADPLVSRGKF